MVKYIDYVDENCYSKIIDHGNNSYTIETNAYICEGLYKKLDENKAQVNLKKWYDKQTKRCKGKTNKLFNHTQNWFAHMVKQGLEV